MPPRGKDRQLFLAIVSFSGEENDPAKPTQRERADQLQSLPERILISREDANLVFDCLNRYDSSLPFTLPPPALSD